MKKFKINTDLKVKLSIILISLLILIGILSYQFTDQNFYIISTIIGILILITFILSIIGFIRSIKNFKRPKTKRRIFFLKAIKEP